MTFAESRSGRVHAAAVVNSRAAVLIVGAAVGAAIAAGGRAWLAVVAVFGLAAVVVGLRASGIIGRPHPSIGLALLLLSVPLRSLMEIDLAGITVGLTEAVLPIAVFWLVAFRRPGPFAIPKPAMLLVVFVGLAVVTAFWALRLPPAFKEFAKWIEVIVALLATFDLARNPRDLRPVLIMGGAAMTVEAVLGLAQTALGVGPQSFLIGRTIRAYGTFQQPNPFAGYLGLHLPFALAFALRGERWWRWTALLLWIAGAGAVALSLSRGAWIAVVAGSAIVIWYSGGRRLIDRRLVVAAVVIPTLILAFGHFNFGLDDRIPEPVRLAGEGFASATEITEGISEGNFAILQRLAFWTAAGRMFASNPVGGVGLGNYETRYQDFNLGSWEDSLGHAHNFYLNMAAETGVMGLAPFLAFLAVLLVAARRAADSAPVLRTAAIASLGSIGAFVVHNMVDSVFVGGMGVVLGAAAGLALAADYKKCETPTSG